MRGIDTGVVLSSTRVMYAHLRASYAGAPDRYVAANSGDLRLLNATLHPEEVDVADRNGWTPLHHACMHGHIHVITWLLDHCGADLESRHNGRTPLCCAARWGQHAVLELLLKRGANPRSLDFYGSLPLHDACNVGDVECVRMLLAADPSIVLATSNGGETGLHRAVFSGSLACCRLLLDGGADVDARKKKDGSTPLARALHAKCFMIARLLVDRGAQLHPLKGTYSGSVPESIVASVSRGNSWRATVAVLSLQRRCSPIIGTLNGRDVLRLVGRIVWSSRYLTLAWTGWKNPS